ncbi:hypothetical protein DSO57_1029697 [Entomophthora muscae]|uniref:Uncharacterized protein n=1 Tax=Entomophthora muscae TaxID=34485 RepID=A0ACC2RFW5_9FUNG|nr:hypothetical protein DSO57_1029697 [Entomophthora muscae]
MAQMKNYNQNSGFQAQANSSSFDILKTQAKIVSERYGDFHLADLGCSHGRNSMECVKAAFDGYTGNPSSIRVYLNDLPTNDFGEVFKCLNDPVISYHHHPLARQSSISTYVNGQDFYTQCLPDDHVHLSFSYNCLHWLSTTIPLSRALFASSERVTAEEAEVLAKSAHEHLLSFLTSRSKELKHGGRLVLVFVKGGTGISYFEDLWEAYVKSTAIELESLAGVVVPTYNRTDAEVQLVLDNVQDKFKTITKTSFRHEHGRFTLESMKSVIFNAMVNSLATTGVFKTRSECEEYIDGFFLSASTDPPSHIIDFHTLVLEKL